jgi:fluoride ion exporter CrcB/FEX
VREALAVGFLGGFTTFSTFSVQIDARGRRR